LAEGTKQSAGELKINTNQSFVEQLHSHISYAS